MNNYFNIYYFWFFTFSSVIFKKNSKIKTLLLFNRMNTI